MRPCGVVVGDPLVERVLGDPEIAEHLARVELDAHGAVEALDLARGGGRARPGEQMLHAVLAADAVEQHFHGRLCVPAREDLALSVSTCSGTPWRRSAALNPSQTSL